MTCCQIIEITAKIGFQGKKPFLIKSLLDTPLQRVQKHIRIAVMKGKHSSNADYYEAFFIAHNQANEAFIYPLNHKQCQ